MSLTVEIRDPYTAGHQIRVATLARAIAEHLGLPEEKVEAVYFAGLVHDIGQAIWSVNPDLPLYSVRTLRAVYDKSLARTSFALVMLAIAGAMALLLGLIGIYGVISYSVSQRTREIGIRMALGSPRKDVTRLFLLHGLRLSAMGVVCGLAGAGAATRLMSSLLFEVSPLDPATYAAVSAVLVAAALAASYAPAHRATTIEPVEALRVE